MDELADRLTDVRSKIDRALTATEADGSASPVLLAVVREFQAKAVKAGAAPEEAAAREGVIELEQAGDSAKAAAEADSGVSQATRQAVLDAHLAICMLKAKM